MTATMRPGLFILSVVLVLLGETVRADGPDWSDRSTIPITGDAVPALQPFDDLVTTMLAEHGIPGASLCVARNGRVVYARGFGHADREAQEPVRPASLFRIASVSKPITAAAVLQLVEREKLRLDENPFEVIGYSDALRGEGVDARLRDITIERLLHHTAGWDRNEAFDPMFAYRRISAAMAVPSPPTQRAIIEFMLSQPLQFDPGTRYAYSNFGYCLLGRVIERRSGQSYEAYVRDHVLGPLGITDMRIGRSLPAQRAPNEVRYYDEKDRTGFASRAPDERVPRPYVVAHEIMDAHGAWIASARDLVTIAIALRDTARGVLGPASVDLMYRVPTGPIGHEPDGSVKSTFYGCGWRVRPVGADGFNSWHMGLIDGTSSLLVYRHDDLAWAVLFNSDRSRTTGKMLAEIIDPLLHRAASRVERWPE